MEISNFIYLCDKYLEAPEVEIESTYKDSKKIYEAASADIGNQALIWEINNHLKKHLMIFNHKNGLNYKKYFPIIEAINEIARCKGESEVSSEETNWEELIKIVVNNKKSIHFFRENRIHVNESSLNSFAKSYIWLEGIGVKFKEHEREFYISEESHELLARQIDQACKEYGGDGLVEHLSERLGSIYNSTTGRFMEHRYISHMNEDVHVAIPFGYLLAIVSKYAGTKGNKSKEALDKLWNLVISVIVIFEIQPYNPHAAAHVRFEKMIHFIKDNLLYDNFVGIPQLKATYASSFIDFLKKNYENSHSLPSGKDIKDIARVSQAIISISKTRSFVDVNINEISKKSKISRFKVNNVMERFLSVSVGSVNSNLTFPPKSINIDHYFKPAIKIGEKYKLFPKSIASLGCVNSILHSITFSSGKFDKVIDGKLGYLVEDYLRKAFKSKGIKFSHGDRYFGKPDLEVDLLCETDLVIYLFEMKKKVLTRETLSGNDLKIYQDLADSVLHSQSQALRIENALLKNETIHLSYKGSKESISLKGRSVVKISLGLSDFGALNDSIIFSRFLNSVVNTTVKCKNDELDHKLNNWRKYVEIIKNMAQQNGEFEVKASPFFNSLCMSIPQLITILEYSKNDKDFFEYLGLLKSVTTSSRDFYTEFLHLKQRFKRN